MPLLLIHHAPHPHLVTPHLLSHRAGSSAVPRQQKCAAGFPGRHEINPDLPSCQKCYTCGKQIFSDSKFSSSFSSATTASTTARPLTNVLSPFGWGVLRWRPRAALVRFFKIALCPVRRAGADTRTVAAADEEPKTFPCRLCRRSHRRPRRGLRSAIAGPPNHPDRGDQRLHRRSENAHVRGRNLCRLLHPPRYVPVPKGRCRQRVSR